MDKILKETKPANIQIEEPTKFEGSRLLKTIVINPAFQRADRVREMIRSIAATIGAS